MSEYAGFWVRLVAEVLDAIFILALSILGGFFAGLAGVQLEQFTELLTSPAAAAASIFLVILYESAMASSAKQATLGKLALGVKVTDLEGTRISFGRALGRAFLKQLPGLLVAPGFFPVAPSLIIQLLSVLMLIFDSRKRSLHDRIAGTLVVEARSHRE